MLAIALVLGTAGRNGFREIAHSVMATFVWLSIGVVGCGLVIHVVARIFA
jgi:hypothetical protein